MAFTVLAAVAIAVAAAIYSVISGLRGNIAMARKTDLVYLVTRKWHRHVAFESHHVADNPVQLYRP